jgi:two-component system, sensor histidine kinase
VLDVMLPDVTGWDVCRRLKANPDTAHILVVHVSATCLDREHEQTSLSTGADAYLRTPMEDPSLVTTVRALLARKAAGTAQQPDRLR